MNKWVELILGILLILTVILAAIYNNNIWISAKEFLKGGIFWLIALIGLLFVMLGLSDLKE